MSGECFLTLDPKQEQERQEQLIVGGVKELDFLFKFEPFTEMESGIRWTCSAS